MIKEPKERRGVLARFLGFEQTHLYLYQCTVYTTVCTIEGKATVLVVKLTLLGGPDVPEADTSDLIKKRYEISSIHLATRYVIVL